MQFAALAEATLFEPASAGGARADENSAQADLVRPGTPSEQDLWPVEPAIRPSRACLPTLFTPPRLIVPLPHEPPSNEPLSNEPLHDEPGSDPAPVAPLTDDAPPEKTVARSHRFGFRRILKATFVVALFLLTLGTIVGLWNLRAVDRALPPIPARPAALLPVESTVLAADGSELGRIFAERRRWMPLSGMAPEVPGALIAVEDHRFREHDGVDYRRLFGAVWASINGRDEGASTIPMQLARNYFPEIANNGRYMRKVKEILMARRLSDRFTKDEILEWYLNTVPFGHNSFGIDAAAERFFSKSASDLNLSEASLLVGVLKGTTRFDPFQHPEIAVERRNLVLRRMVETDAISPNRASSAAATRLELNPSIIDPAASIAPHFVDYVRQEVEEWAKRTGYDVARDGLTIHTTLDPAVQTLAQQAVDRQTAVLQRVVNQEFGAPGSRAFERYWLTHRTIETNAIRHSAAFALKTGNGLAETEAVRQIRLDQSVLDDIRRQALRLEAGFVAIEPRTGLVRAWIGGRNYKADQFDKVAAAHRQPGSTFKPFVYTAAIDAGFSPYYMVEDKLRSFTDIRGKTWTPTNSGGGVTGRLYTLRQGLAWSKNTVSVHLTQRLGAQRVVETARSMGIESQMLPVPSIALGTVEVTLLELVDGYVTLADYGTRHRPVVISHIEDRWGRTVASFTDQSERVLSTQTSYTMIDMMRGVIDAGTGAGIRTAYGVPGDLAGKTGTTQNNADGWFVLMHSDLVAGAWVGFNDPRIAFRSDYWGQGGHNALRLVGDFYAAATRGRSPLLGRSRFRPPPGYRPPPVPVASPDEPGKDLGVDGSPERLTPLGTRSSGIGKPTPRNR